MMGRLNQDQGGYSISFCLDDAVPGDHRVREIAAVLDLSWVHAKLKPYYSRVGRPSIDPMLRIRMLDHRLRVRHPLRASAVPRGAGESGLSLVLWAEHRGPDSGPFSILA